MKLQVYKGTQKRKWKETTNAAEKWWNFENTILEQLEVLSAEYTQNVPEILEFKIPKSDYKFAALVGISDTHYLKLCYDHLGNVVYNREIAKKLIKEHSEILAKEISRYGRPERLFVIIGNDNIHVDGIHHSTTKLTPQHNATDGLWRLELKNYIKIQFDLINFYKQIAPVTIIPVKGNHDYETSIALHAFTELHYENDEQVEVLTCHDARAYVQYEETCLIATHGDELGSVKNLESKIHMMVMGEAKNHGIDVQKVNRFLLIHGHEHVDSSRDLNGNIQRIGLPSLSATDDWWHKGNGYVGRRPESKAIIIDPREGRKAILYT
jgi:hypothetical protein